jgi:hypothetical protein
MMHEPPQLSRDINWPQRTKAPACGCCNMPQIATPPRLALRHGSRPKMPFKPGFRRGSGILSRNDSVKKSLTTDGHRWTLIKDHSFWSVLRKPNGAAKTASSNPLPRCESVLIGVHPWFELHGSGLGHQRRVETAANRSNERFVENHRWTRMDTDSQPSTTQSDEAATKLQLHLLTLVDGRSIAFSSAYRKLWI